MRRIWLLWALGAGLLLPAQEIYSEKDCWFEDAAAVGESVWLLCDRQEVKLSRDGGNSWQDVRAYRGEEKLRAIAFGDTRRGVIVGERGILLRSEDGGRTWTRVDAGTTENLREAFFVGDRIWIAGHGGVLLHSADAGRSWAQQESGTTFPLESLHFADAEQGWAVGWNGTILRTTDGGKQWEPVESDAAQWSLRSVYFRDHAEGWAVGFMGQLLHTRDGGESWEELASPVKGTLTAVVFDAEGKGWISSDQQLLTSADGGRTWQPTKVTNWVFLERLVAGGDSVWAISPFGVLRKVRGQPDWKPVRFGAASGGRASASGG